MPRQRIVSILDRKVKEHYSIALNSRRIARGEPPRRVAFGRGYNNRPLTGMAGPSALRRSQQAVDGQFDSDSDSE